MLKRSPWIQIIIGYAALEVAFWTEGRAQAIASLVATAIIIALTFLSLRPARVLGLEWPDLPCSLWSAAIAILAAAVIVLIAIASGSVHPLYGSLPIGEHTAAYLTWALVQQFILQSFFYVRVETTFGNTWKTVVIVAVLFAIAHIPNPVLMPATFIGGLFFCGSFRRYRTIYPLAAAHAILGLAMAISVPDPLLHHMRVGLAYLHYT